MQGDEPLWLARVCHRLLHGWSTMDLACPASTDRGWRGRLRDDRRASCCGCGGLGCTGSTGPAIDLAVNPLDRARCRDGSGTATSTGGGFGFEKPRRNGLADGLSLIEREVDAQIHPVLDDPDGLSDILKARSELLCLNHSHGLRFLQRTSQAG